MFFFKSLPNIMHRIYSVTVLSAESDCRYYLNPQFFPGGYNASVFS
ncbi:hypothetical protein M092_4343 [Parabacteroides distasonis str. 3776 D15 iv]|uniref:Uncharacterized protein n=1 Tax=Parabacteroides distasonis str. 3776 D15 i TaxID=1339342 RepID=A0AB34L9Z5_PARDI|nr:hypothetical protein M091_0946 [Parabacteroides distasonis str. 3776 D15 i]KDS46418.1 hypothetical protein M090_3732 [Parabacteroides distasonis str. 3776 Po2 i]KDS67058.1 hypothetical protein M092_4343 [Parabacteroides distasonis str. 3776 D15 iv]